MYHSNEEVKFILPQWLGSKITLSEKISGAYFSYLQTIANLGEHLILRAARASQHSVSYRPFPVGSAVLGVFTHSSNLCIHTGHNMKVGETERVTRSEVIAIGSALQSRCTHIPLMAVVGNPQSDHGSGIESLTLHPCYRCRSEMSAQRLITADTIILTATHVAAELIQQDTDETSDYQTWFDDGNKYPIGQPFTVVSAIEGACENISLDGLIQRNLVEVMTFAELLKMHDNVCSC